ncbi:MAG: glycerate kinase type-2 family protein, partial [Candidatus Rokuibacteriota bacterium]
MTGRQAAHAIWQAALAAGAVEPLIRRALHVHGSRLTAGDRSWNLDALDRVIVLGCGKAGGAMARALEAVLGDRIAEGFVVVKDGYTSATSRVHLAEAGHPVPDARGQAAAARLLALAESAGQNDLVVFLVSGGGSALTPAPAPGVSLEEKGAMTGLLLAAGATINELNAVRKHVSSFKGGQLARAASPAPMLALILSDVIGDPLDVIASGPTAPDPTTFGDALDVLARRGVLDRVPPSVRSRLEAGRRGEVDETPKPGDPLFERVSNRIVGNNAIVVAAAAARARALGYEAHVLTRELQGEAREVAADLVERARRLAPPACLIAGGETTVTVR